MSFARAHAKGLGKIMPYSEAASSCKDNGAPLKSFEVIPSLIIIARIKQFKQFKLWNCPSFVRRLRTDED